MLARENAVRVIGTVSSRSLKSRCVLNASAQECKIYSWDTFHANTHFKGTNTKGGRTWRRKESDKTLTVPVPNSPLTSGAAEERRSHCGSRDERQSVSMTVIISGGLSEDCCIIYLTARKGRDFDAPMIKSYCR